MKKELTFVDWWKDTPPYERDEHAIALSRECNTALTTVHSWGMGYRTPRGRSQVIIAEYLRDKRGFITDIKTLFP